ncbi:MULTISPECIES: AMP-binding protein [Marinomonas]|uniref:Acyl-CoA synthetase (AMP-forming)/AMP-acid ligase II n=1 Tax=Marinomonas alcarazii TaxID=491949 RepID=A0A318V9L8_9GAMM|nr:MULTISPECIES: AMP-binding protein [Marinomonas]PYF84501.1 acyl-CoA synthetase (AMP-forming)/AMP-acid ligase II [Marinomonas alcarazii]
MKQTVEPKNWIGVLEQQAKDYSDKVAFGYSAKGAELDHQITFSELAARAKSLAVVLRQHVEQGERALLLMPNGIDYVVGFFACVYAGVIAVPAYPPQHRRRDWGRLASITQDCQASLVLCSSGHEEKVNQWRDAQALTCAIVQVDSDKGDQADAWQSPDVDSHDVMFLQYSSGSTGAPKGVMLSHRNLLENTRLISERFDFNADCQCVSWLPMYHDMGMVGYVLTPILKGSFVCLLPPPLVIQSPFAWLQTISRYQEVISGGPNFIFDHCVDRINDEQKQSLDLSGWRTIPNGAEPILEQTLKRFDSAFASVGLSAEAMKPSYGMAEACLFVAAMTTEQSWKTLSSNTSGECVCSGELHPEMPIKIVDPASLQEVEPGEQGEILFKGNSVSAGYWGKPELNRQVFNLTVAGESGYFRSGDLGFVADGHLCINGRLKEMLIVNGVNHFPQDIEATVQGIDEDLTAHGGAAFSLPAVAGQPERVVLVQELSRHGLRRADLAELTTAIRQVVAQVHELSLSAVILISPASLPKTTSGKIQRLKCRDLYQDSALTIVHQWHKAVSQESVLPEVDMPLEPSAEDVVLWLQWWVAQRLSTAIDQVPADAELAALGLDSIDAMTLMHDLEQAMQTSIAQELMWSSPSLEAFAQAITAQQQTLMNSAKYEDESMLEGEI